MKTKFLFAVLFTFLTTISIAQTSNFNNIQLPDGYINTKGNLWFGGQTQNKENGMRLFGGTVNGGTPAGFIDVRTTDLDDGLRLRVSNDDGGIERMRITARGNVGIGTTTPLSKLSVNGKGLSKYTGYFHTNSTATGSAAVYGNAAKITIGNASSAGVAGRIESGKGYARGVFGTSYNPAPQSAGRAYGGYFQAGNATSRYNYGVFATIIGANHGAAVFGWDKVTNASGSWTMPNKSYAGFFVGDAYVSGNVGIGVKSPQNKLDVCGTVRATEVNVESGWCDYVFTEEFNMPTLQEEAQFIEAKGHLLSFESAEDMNGEIKLGDVTKRQQETIEKLMLHVIKMDQEIQALKAQNEAGK